MLLSVGLKYLWGIFVARPPYFDIVNMPVQLEVVIIHIFELKYGRKLMEAFV